MRYRWKAFTILICILLGESLVINGIHLKIEQKIHFYQEDKTRIVTIQRKIMQDLQYFPISLSHQKQVTYEDSYGAYRENGGHEGCDVMSLDNVPGVIPVISATDGTITNIGWLYLGGYRVGIMSKNGIYYYYAHLDSYANGLTTGKTIKAGELLGFMGNTGEGVEGTEGKFPVHLHFGIYIKDKNGNEESVNPYPFLTKINE